MNYCQQIKKVIIYFLGLIFLLNIVVNGAEKITIEQAIENALLENNYLQESMDTVKEIELKLRQLETSLAWQVDLSASGLLDEFKNPFLDYNRSYEFKLEGSKNYLWGLNFSTELIIEDNNPFQWENMKDNTEMILNLNQHIYPRVPNQLEKNYILLNNSLFKANENLKITVDEKKLEWLESYLNLIRLKQGKEIALSSLDLAKDNLERILQKKAIGEAGERQVLQVKINVKQRERNFKQIKNNFLQKKQVFYQELAIDPNLELILESEPSYIEKVKEKLNYSKINVDNKEDLIEIVLNNNFSLQALLRDKEILEKEIQWSQEERKPSLNANARLNQEGDWLLAINFSYNLWDGGENKIANQKEELDLLALERKKRQLKENLAQQLVSLLNQIDLDMMYLEEQELSLAKSFLEKEFLQKQKVQGLVTEMELNEQNLAVRQAEVDLKKAEDSLLISKLRLYNFLRIKRSG